MEKPRDLQYGNWSVEKCSKALRDQLDLLKNHTDSAGEINYKFVRIHALMAVQLAEQIIFVQDQNRKGTAVGL